MHKVITLAAAFALAAVAHAAPAAAQSLAQGNTFGDWGVECAENGKNCHLVQKVSNAETGEDVLLARVGQVSADGQKKVRLMLVGPLGVMLTPGVAVQIDEQEGHRVPFVQCAPQGCQTTITLDDATIALMKAGQVMKVGMTPPNGKMVVMPVSLSGFTAGVAALQQQ